MRLRDCPPEIQEEVQRVWAMYEAEREGNKRLREALSDLVTDLEDRAGWMRFSPDKDGKTVPCGTGVYIRAKDALSVLDTDQETGK